jgi:RNA polymerase sigma-70 factor (ECF subfamily)
VLPPAFVSGGPGAFPDTRWTQVLAARSHPEKRRALTEELIGARWRPLYLYARQRGLPPDRAEDVVQGLLLQLIEHDFLDRLDPERGSLRGYLKRALKHYLVNLHEHDAAEKRGGGKVPLSIDAGEALLVASPADPEGAFDREWALDVFSSALSELEKEFEGGKRRGPIEVLRELFSFGAAPPYEELARAHGMSVSQLKSFVHRGRRRFRQLILARVADTVSTAAEAENELNELLRALEAG